jgi:hypothetical protein
VPSQHGHQSSGRIIRYWVTSLLVYKYHWISSLLRSELPFGEELARQIGVHSKMLEPMLGPSD